MQDVRDRRSMIEKIDNFNSIRLIPEMNFTCAGTTKKVTVVGKRQNNMREPMKLQIWRLENSTAVDGRARYQRVENIDLTFNICSDTNVSEIMINRRNISIYGCILRESVQVSVEPEDIIGIELPPEQRANFKLYSATGSGLTNYIFKPKPDYQSSTIDLSNRTIETTVLPLVRIEVKPSRTGE